LLQFGKRALMKLEEIMWKSGNAQFFIFFWPCVVLQFWYVTNLIDSFFYNMFVWILYVCQATLCSSSGGRL
jgi:hypothetical protein